MPLTTTATFPTVSSFPGVVKASGFACSAEDSLFFLRGDLQIAADSLLSSEQFGLGGAFKPCAAIVKMRLLRDNGALLSAEARFPDPQILRYECGSSSTILRRGRGVESIPTVPDGNNVLVGTGV